MFNQLSLTLRAPHIPSLSLLLPSFHPSSSLPSSSLTREREREIDGCYPGPIFASREGSSRKMSIPETANVVVLRQGLVVTFHAPRSVIADTHPSPRRATANYCPLHRDALPLRRQFHAEIHCEIIRRREGEREKEGGWRGWAGTVCQYRVPRRLINV